MLMLMVIFVDSNFSIRQAGLINHQPNLRINARLGWQGIASSCEC